MMRHFPAFTGSSLVYSIQELQPLPPDGSLKEEEAEAKSVFFLCAQSGGSSEGLVCYVGGVFHRTVRTYS
jgi:hypothetical protein